MQPTEQHHLAPHTPVATSTPSAAQPDLLDPETLRQLPCFLRSLARELSPPPATPRLTLEALHNWPQTLGYEGQISLMPQQIELTEAGTTIRRALRPAPTDESATAATNASIICASPAIAARYNARGVPALWISAIEAHAVDHGQPLEIPLPMITSVNLDDFSPAVLCADRIQPQLEATLTEQAITGGILEFIGATAQQLSADERLKLCKALLQSGYQGFFPCSEEVSPSATDTQPLYSHSLSLQPGTASPAGARIVESQYDQAILNQLRDNLPGLQQRPAYAPQADHPILARCAHTLTTDELCSLSQQNIAGILFGTDDFGTDTPDGQEISCLQAAAGGVTAVIASSLNPRYRQLLINQGIYPLEFIEGDSWQALELTGEETLRLDIPDEIYPYEPVMMTLNRHNGRRELVELTLRLDSAWEIERCTRGGLLQPLT